MAATLTKPKTSAQAALEGRTELIALGERIRDLRTDRGLSQEALSEAAGISRPTLSKIERGVEDVGVRRLFRLADELEVSVADLFHD